MNFRVGSTDGSKRKAVVVDLTALIDVIFQLLIFFLLTSTYVTQQAASAAQIPVELPESSLSETAIPHEQMTITVTATGEMLLDVDEIAGVDELTVRLLEVRAKNPKTIVLVRGDQAVPYGRIASVLAAIRAANLPVSAVLNTAE
ncbi:MAG: biopolymer transporter ExbD [Myxococcota bacterium]|nr:biopolymer transporter ExbD [Myxococcota bacterium]